MEAMTTSAQDANHVGTYLLVAGISRHPKEPVQIIYTNLLH